jgi:hypothetical protein
VFRALLGNDIIRPRRISLWLILMISFCFPSLANAEMLILQSGQKIVGQIIERTELRVTVDVQGVPQTFFLGEIASIDGQAVEVPHVKSVETAGTEKTNPTEEKMSNNPHFKDEKDSLARFMSRRNPNGPSQNQPTNQKAPVPYRYQANTTQMPNVPYWAHRPPAYQDAAKLDALVLSLHEIMDKMASMNKNVVSTPEGGIIVVSPGKIIKYDKNLKPVKEVDLK